MSHHWRTIRRRQADERQRTANACAALFLIGLILFVAVMSPRWLLF